MAEVTPGAESAGLDDVAVVAALADQVRRALYLAVRAERRPVSREEAASAVGVSRKLAAFHLDKLVSVGLLVVCAGASAPRRVGRAPKLYAPSHGGVRVSVPARRHLELAEMLVEAMSTRGVGESPDGAARRIAADRGRALVDRRAPNAVRSAELALDLAADVLAEHGYEPYRADATCIRLHNCPFHPLAQAAPEFVCALNGAFLAGVVDGIGSADVEVSPVSSGDECCAEIRQRQ